jgi:hypothetical protein
MENTDFTYVSTARFWFCKELEVSAAKHQGAAKLPR